MARIKGIPVNGADAYKEGVMAADCPYFEEDEEFTRWNKEWDDAADAAVLGKAQSKGSVVTNRYRAQYSELGHPTHCGDELAILLNNLCLNKAGVNIEYFEMICAANGIDLRKYDKKARGWQGRMRMTGRNLLAKRVRENKGKLIMPDGNIYQLSEDWLYTAERKFKPKGGPS